MNRVVVEDKILKVNMPEFELLLKEEDTSNDSMLKTSFEIYHSIFCCNDGEQSIKWIMLIKFYMQKLQ